MSHELRTPLNAILGFSEMLAKGIAGPLGVKQEEYAEIIHKSGGHLLEIINEVLDLAKIDAGKAELNEEEIDPGEIVNACFEIVKEHAHAGNLHLSMESKELMPAVRADARRLRQILINLLANAIKFTKPAGSVVVAFRRTADGGIAFDVRDSGPGMTAAEIDIAMQPFGQVDSGHDRRHQGTGLGLPLARSLAELHGGSLQVDSQKGRGTTVTVLLPSSRVVDRARRHEGFTAAA
jgi:two-component system cell cycle sensor histidine kinase PleC